MSWIRANPFGNPNIIQNKSSNSQEYDPTACFNSFKKHWQQISDIIENAKDSRTGVKQDEVLAVVSILDHMISLLQLELSSTNPAMMCLKYIFNENILDSFFTWSVQIGKSGQPLVSEQLKLYEVLVSFSNEKLFSQNLFSQPLLRLLKTCSDVPFSFEDEKRLVVLLNHLCVSFIHQKELLYYYFEKRTNGSPKFVIFSLLIPHVHREGTLGQQVRDSLLLCMALSKQNDLLAEYIALHSDICPILATGISGLYSRLPRTLNIEVEDWFCLTPDDVNDLPELAAFMNLLDFCNAAVQVAHPNLVKNILAYIYQGFLGSVLGNALLQNSDQELIAATAYLDLFIRSLTEPSLIYCFVKYILMETYDGQRLLDILVDRLNDNSKLGLVSLSLMQTLIDLNCEDIMLELVLKYLIPCNHIMESQKCLIGQKDPYCENAERFLLLAPNIERSDKSEGSLYGDYQAYLSDVRCKIEACAKSTSSWAYSYNGENPSFADIGVVLHTCDDGELEHPSLPSADDQSSGYESFIRSTEVTSDCGSGGEYDSPSGSEISSEKTQCVPCLSNLVGPFLHALFNKLEYMLTNSLYLNLLLTGLISRLAVYPQPLLSSYLLDHSFIFQPSIRPLFRIIGSLKQRIEVVLSDFSSTQVKSLIEESESILLERENRLVNIRKYALQASSPLLNYESKYNQTRSEKDFKKYSFSSAFNSVFRKRSLNNSSNERNSDQIIHGTRSSVTLNELHNVVMCALLLSEWVKELAAITQEHSVLLAK